MSGSILASLHYSTLRLSEQERFALTAPEKRDKQSTGEGGGGRERERKEKAERGERKGRKRKERKKEEGRVSWFKRA